MASPESMADWHSQPAVDFFARLSASHGITCCLSARLADALLVEAERVMDNATALNAAAVAVRDAHALTGDATISSSA
jgi:hypothetical protein